MGAHDESTDTAGDRTGTGSDVAAQPVERVTGGSAARGVAVAGESAALLAMIERAARDPSVDIDRMERLFKMHEQAEARRARASYIAALSAMQPELPVVEKRGEIARKAKDETGQKKEAKATKYARWEDVVEAISPILAKHGFSISFRIKQDQRVEVTAILGHRDGHCEETSMSLPIDDSGAKNNMQGWGSSISYGKRYTAFALLNIVARGEDDDGKAAGSDLAITDEQAEQIKVALEETGGQLPKFCAFYKLEKLTDLPAAKFDAAMAAIRRVRR